MNKIISYVKNNGSIYYNHDDIPICNNYDNILTNDNYDYVQIELFGKHAENAKTGNIMLLSKSDLPFIMNFKWYLNSNGYPSTYGTIDQAIKYNCPVTLHQLIFGPLEKGYVVDHINRNKLDNRRDNLRICTILQNSYNKSKPKNAKNKYKGVIKNGNKNSSYIASITKDGIKHEIKHIQSEDDAAHIYDMMAEDLFGIYAGKNFSYHT